MPVTGLTIAQIDFAAAHIVLCLFLLWASRQLWSGWSGLLAGLIFQLSLPVLEFGSIALAGEAALQNDFQPLVAFALVPFAAFLWWSSGRNNTGALIANLYMPTRLSRATTRGVQMLVIGLMVEAAILAITLSILWTLLGSAAFFGANAMVPGTVAQLTLKTLATAAPAFEAAGAVSLVGALFAYGLTRFQDWRRP